MLLQNKGNKKKLPNSNLLIRRGLLFLVIILNFMLLLFFANSQWLEGTQQKINQLKTSTLFTSFSYHAFAQDSTIQESTNSPGSIGSEGDLTSGNINSGSVNPSPNVVHNIHISYSKASRDILITYPIQPEVCLVSASPTPIEPFTVCQKTDSITWSVKKIVNPGKTDAELQKITLQPINTEMTFTLTLRPRPGINDIYIVSQAKITLYPLSVGSGTGTSGSIDVGQPVGNAPANTNTCGGKIQINNPDGTNFGDPICTFTEDKLYALLKQQDPDNADFWFNVVIPCESPGYDPNLYYRSGAAGDTPDPSGAWGLFQMGRGLNGQYDHGDVSWTQQVVNATTYRRNVSWRYWACAESRW